MNDKDQKYVELIQTRQKLKAEIFPYTYGISPVTDEKRKEHELLASQIETIEREIKQLQKERR